jgi:hypothetical protein
MDGSFFWSNPSQLTVTCQGAPKAAHIFADLGKRPSHYEARQGTNGGDDDLVASADREGETTPMPAIVGP